MEDQKTNRQAEQTTADAKNTKRPEEILMESFSEEDDLFILMAKKGDEAMLGVKGGHFELSQLVNQSFKKDKDLATVFSTTLMAREAADVADKEGFEAGLEHLFNSIKNRKEYSFDKGSSYKNSFLLNETAKKLDKDFDTNKGSYFLIGQTKEGVASATGGDFQDLGVSINKLMLREEGIEELFTTAVEIFQKAKKSMSEENFRQARETAKKQKGL